MSLKQLLIILSILGAVNITLISSWLGPAAFTPNNQSDQLDVLAAQDNTLSQQKPQAKSQSIKSASSSLQKIPAPKNKTNDTQKDSFVLGKQLETFFFRTGEYELLSIDKAKLYRLARFLRKNRRLRIVVMGWADHRGEAPYNRRLSKLRASAIAFQLRYMGIRRWRIIHRGMGIAESTPYLDKSRRATVYIYQEQQ